MVTGVVSFIAVTSIILFVQSWIFRVVRAQGYSQGTSDEAAQWIAAIQKIQVPNWQSIPPNELGMDDPEHAKLAAQVYVAAYKCCLDVIKEEIAMNRLQAMADDLKLRIVEDQPDNTGYPIA